MYFIHQVAWARRQRRDLSVFESSCHLLTCLLHTAEASHCPLNCWTCSEVCSDIMLFWIYSDSCPVNLLLVQSHQATIIIVKRLIQGCDNVTRVLVESRSYDQRRRKNNAFALLSTLPTYEQEYQLF